MRGSVLIFGGNKNARSQKIEKLVLNNADLEISKNYPDLLKVVAPEGKRSIGIDQVREVIRFLSRKPLEAEKIN